MSREPFEPSKAYENDDFLNSPDARPIRLLSEYLEPMERFEDLNVRDTILVFGSARTLPRDIAEAQLAAAKKSGEDVEAAERALEMSRYYEESRELAFRLTEWSKQLRDGSGRRFVICTGGGPGIMEAANRGASEAKGDNMGLGISLPMEQSNNPYITDRLNMQFHYFFMRKFWFLYLAKAVVIMPGGFGTLDELFESLTLVQTRKVQKHMPIVLYGTAFWDSVINLEALVDYGTISADDLELIHHSDSVDDAFEYITRDLTRFAVELPGMGL
ncbi:MAG: TIGR00730 family Rossman fold protein [Alphaproteobacteria bacterium]